MADMRLGGPVHSACRVLARHLALQQPELRTLRRRLLRQLISLSAYVQALRAGRGMSAAARHRHHCKVQQPDTAAVQCWKMLTGHCIAPLQAMPWFHEHLKTKRMLP